MKVIYFSQTISMSSCQYNQEHMLFYSSSMFVHQFLIIASHSVLNSSIVVIKQLTSAMKAVKNIAGKPQRLVVCIFVSSYRTKYQSVTVRKFTCSDAAATDGESVRGILLCIQLLCKLVILKWNSHLLVELTGDCYT